ncbi:hypothetical protein BLX05_25680 [Bacillus pseudomycoides]|nr:hypothetical protein BLX05_25680 [Bacillus pseudomycoides]
MSYLHIYHYHPNIVYSCIFLFNRGSTHILTFLHVKGFSKLNMGYGNDSGYEGPLWDLITNKKRTLFKFF